MSPTLHHLLALAVCLSLAGCALLALAALGAKFARRVPKLGLWHLPCPVLAALLALAVVAATRSDKNGTNGAARARAPARSPLALASDDAPRVAAIAVTDAGVDLVLHRPAADSALAAAVTVAGSSNYAPGGWEALLDASFATGDTEADVAVPAATLAQHGISDLGFFAFATAGDSDGDGLADWFELLNSRTRGGMRDTDGDGMNDAWEVENELNPIDPSDASEDADGDGATNLEEYLDGTDPQGPDAPASAPRGTRPISFAVGGDWASWEMSIAGKGPDDFRVRRVTMAGAGEGVSRLLELAKGNSYEIRLYWLGCGTHDDVCAPWYCWSAQADGVPLVQTYDNNSPVRRPDVAQTVVGNGWIAENAEGILTEHVHMAAKNLDGSPGGGNVAQGKAATLHVLGDVSVSICNPDDEAWGELEAGRVLLDTEDLRVKVEVAPPLASTELLRALADQIKIKTSGTCPSGVTVPLDASATFVQTATHSEVRISKTREELKALGLVPANDEDGVDEMAWMDMAAAGSSQTLGDSEAFARLGHADRGTASRIDPARSLDSTPPNSVPSESYFKAAGREIVTATCRGTTSDRRQIMNQADVFYFSGHGDHSANRLQGRFTPQMAEGMWNRDLDCIIISGCSVLDINDYGNHYVGAEHLRSPGKVWEQTGPAKLLGYCYIAPGDAGGAPTRIVNAWRAKRAALGDVDAWMAANAENSAWNACAIEKGTRYVFFKTFLRKIRSKTEVRKENW